MRVATRYTWMASRLPVWWLRLRMSSCQLTTPRTLWSHLHGRILLCSLATRPNLLLVVICSLICKHPLPRILPQRRITPCQLSPRFSLVPISMHLPRSCRWLQSRMLLCTSVSRVRWVPTSMQLIAMYVRWTLHLIWYTWISWRSWRRRISQKSWIIFILLMKMAFIQVIWMYHLGWTSGVRRMMVPFGVTLLRKEPSLLLIQRLLGAAGSQSLLVSIMR